MRLEDDASDGKGRKRRSRGKRGEKETEANEARRNGGTIERGGDGIERDEKDGRDLCGARSLYLSCCSYPRRSVSYPRLALNPGCASPNETVASSMACTSRPTSTTRTRCILSSRRCKVSVCCSLFSIIYQCNIWTIVSRECAHACN